ncbi:hypothetical protein B1L04_10530 [Microcystis aeruginosa KW]|uniref:Uncharacterized protein n=1 Tax=Microcystis aeruginosa KW TaxID=1960155 RepID=A0A1V4BUW1_MICAE|nr:hypothetical protein B1L04_10530 [Microcystis aeruginosa KW]
MKGGSTPPLSRDIPPPIGTPLIKGYPPAYRHPPYQGISPRLSAPPLSRGAGGSKTKSIFNLIITTYLYDSNSRNWWRGSGIFWRN